MSRTIMQTEHIQNLIFTIRGVPVMLDRDLAVVYGVETKVLNQAVKRNIARFPQEFRFQINEEERDELVTICDRFEPLKHSTVNPYAFTEQGVSMLSAVLRSDTAVKVSIQIMNAFVQMRRFIQDNAKVFERLELVERRQLVFKSETEKNFEKVFQALERRDTPPEQGIFYNGQVYDAWSFASDLVRRAEKSLVLIDNYVDDSVLTLLSKRSADVLCTIYTKTISRQLALDLKKHNQQYPQIALKSFPDAHDRFLLIDGVEIYHIGASLKDLGKKWFAFSRFETGALEMLNKLEGK
ncbi:ORF6N domain-containing protein [Prosthecochloris sp. N3]|uniref:ORF6N domain-containing protein n=1 Tax=Prosthecochloris ethylica TaxID=2743976 RepID=A0ABR9XQ82_9CHLB|nr:ORF6N domain-containing protein [Prosthecochloris ethylica]MBF0585406.1 ORF6N domain-containing protein [Prosthecochloris ethylica]MBF0636192.1 ORF6N domain-containing protein [Prosthecochloris ethylica]NUK46636.1 ORF6N domain-containing protein [Prosthecochloris ethylica]